MYLKQAIRTMIKAVNPAKTRRAPRRFKKIAGTQLRVAACPVTNPVLGSLMSCRQLGTFSIQFLNQSGIPRA